MQQRLMALVFGTALVVSLGVALVGTPHREASPARAASTAQAMEMPAAEPLAEGGCGMADCASHGPCGMAGCPKVAAEPRPADSSAETQPAATTAPAAATQ